MFANKFLSQRCMRELRYEESVLNSIQKRRKTQHPIWHMICSCPARDCASAFIAQGHQVLTSAEGDLDLKFKKKVRKLGERYRMGQLDKLTHQRLLCAAEDEHEREKKALVASA